MPMPCRNQRYNDLSKHFLSIPLSDSYRNGFSLLCLCFYVKTSKLVRDKKCLLRLYTMLNIKQLHILFIRNENFSSSD